MNDQAMMLIGRLIEGELTDSDWADLCAQAERDPSLWRAAAEAQRDAAVVRAAVDRAGEAAERVSLPLESGGTKQAARAADSRSPRVAYAISAWSGWAVAAVLAIIAGTLMLADGQQWREPTSSTGEGGLVRIAAPEDALAEYIERGRAAGLVVSELPQKIVIESRPSPTGQGYELLYVRQLLERAHVDDFYTFSAQDELGRPQLVRLEPETGGSL